MENAVTGIPQRRMDREGVANLVIVTIITGAIVVILARPCGPSLAEKFRLALLFDYVFALWIAWSMPTTRVVALALVGALVGFVTECTAICTGLWIYPCYPLGVGVLIYALSAIGVFGMVYILNRILLRHAFFKTTAWLNSLIVVLIFLSLFLWAYREHDGDYLKLMVTQKWVLVYYAVLFFLAVTLAYCLRLGTLIAIIISAALVSLVGQTAGGVKAMIWLFLPDAHPAVTSPPQYLVYALWPLEYVVEFGLSAALADYLTYLFKVKEQKRAEKSLTPSLKIPFYDRRPDEDFISFLVRLNERSFAKLLRRSPETGQVFVALVGSLVAVFALFPNDTTPVDWATVIAIAALFGVALLVSPHPFWKRTVGLAVGGLVVGFGLWTATDLALLNVGPEAHFLCAPLCALLFVAIYGAAYLKTQLAARLFPCECEWNDNGEPRRSVATTVAVLTLIFVALLIWRPSFAFGATPVANGANPTLLIFLAGVPAIFLVWWFFPLVPLRRSVIQTVTAFFGSAVVVLPFCWPLESRTAWLRLLVLAGSLTIGYLFAYTGSAHVANEPLAKGIRRTYWRMPFASGSFADARNRLAKSRVP